MVILKVVGFMFCFGLFFMDMKMKDNMKILCLLEFLVYSVFICSEFCEFVCKIVFESFFQMLDDIIILVQLFLEDVFLINLYFFVIFYGYVFVFVMENSVVFFDVIKLGVVGKDFLEMDIGYINQFLLVWVKIVKIVVDDVIVSGFYDNLLFFMKYFYVF